MRAYTVRALAIFFGSSLFVALVWLPQIRAGQQITVTRALILALIFAAASFGYWINGRRMARFGEPLVPLKLKRLDDVPQWQRDSMNRVRWRAFEFAMSCFVMAGAVAIVAAIVTRDANVAWPCLGILLIMVPGQVVSFAYRKGIRDAQVHLEDRRGN